MSIFFQIFTSSQGGERGGGQENYGFFPIFVTFFYGSLKISPKSEALINFVLINFSFPACLNSLGVDGVGGLAVSNRNPSFIELELGLGFDKCT